MSQNAKVVRNKINFSKIKDKLTFLWSNSRCKEYGYTKKWYFAVIAALASVIVACVPSLVHTYQTEGGTFLSSTLYGFDDAYKDFLADVESRNYDIKFNEETKSCEISNLVLSPDNDYLIYEHIMNADPNSAVSTYKDLQVYYVPEEVTFYDQYTKLSALNTNTSEGRDTTLLMFGKSQLCLYIYAYGNTSVKGGAYGDYSNLNGITSIKDLIKKENDVINKKESITALQGFINNAYESNKGNLALTQTGLNLASNIGVTLLMGLMLFVLTRSKNNPNREYKFQQIFNMTYWTTITPAILALVLGFLFKGYEIMLYVVFFGFRTMYMSMKQLSPIYQ